MKWDMSEMCVKWVSRFFFISAVHNQFKASLASTTLSTLSLYFFQAPVLRYNSLSTLNITNTWLDPTKRLASRSWRQSTHFFLIFEYCNRIETIASAFLNFDPLRLFRVFRGASLIHQCCGRQYCYHRCWRRQYFYHRAEHVELDEVRITIDVLAATTRCFVE